MYAPLTHFLMEMYGSRGGLFLVGTVMLNLCVCGCLIMEPPWWIKMKKEKRKVGIELENINIMFLCLMFFRPFKNNKGLPRRFARGKNVRPERPELLERREWVRKYYFLH